MDKVWIWKSVVRSNTFGSSFDAILERVAFMTLWTVAIGNMMMNFAQRIATTRAQARIYAFITEACFIQWTISMGFAFNTTSRVRVSFIRWDASTRCLIISIVTFYAKSYTNWTHGNAYQSNRNVYIWTSLPARTPQGLGTHGSTCLTGSVEWFRMKNS